MSDEFVIFDSKERKRVHERIEWLKQKLSCMRSPSNPDYTSSKQLWGRIEGEIGGLEWMLEQKEVSQ